MVTGTLRTGKSKTDESSMVGDELEQRHVDNEGEDENENRDTISKGVERSPAEIWQFLRNLGALHKAGYTNICDVCSIAQEPLHPHRAI
ncbi:hypothetical protein Ancab_004980 [Ancistrocladus abbreviatus]